MTFQDAFHKLELDEIALVLEDINPVLDGVDFDPVQTSILALEPSFYPGYKFLDIEDRVNTPPLRRFVLYKKADSKNAAVIKVLNWTNEPIYMLNLEAPIQLNSSNVAEYTSFFFTYVRGKHGRFIISENVDDMAWKEDPPPQARKAIAKMLMPVTLISEKGGEFFLEATMMFRDCLFKASITVKQNGLVSLSDEELLVEDIPVLDDIFGQ